MILIDFSSIVHRMVNVTAPSAKLVNGKHKTSDYIGKALSSMFEELLLIEKSFKTYGDLVICLDDSSKSYWRKDFYKPYKMNRKKGREDSKIEWGEVFPHVKKFTDQIDKNLPWKVISTPKAEADDIILVLAREYGANEPILIHSPDKDLIQAQLENSNVKQYSALTRKWIYPENKHESMEHWTMEHVCLGDSSDGVPKVVEHTEFSDSFKKYLKENSVDEIFHNVHEFKKGDGEKTLDQSTKISLLESFDVWKTNKKGEKTEKDVYKTMRFGPDALNKAIKKHGSLENWLDSHPLYREHYERNFTLVMEQGIPNEVWNACVADFISAPTKYNKKEFENYIENNNLLNLSIYLNHFINGELTAENCGW